jgi:hypothetical protein
MLLFLDINNPAMLLFLDIYALANSTFLDIYEANAVLPLFCCNIVVPVSFFSSNELVLLQ